MDGFIPDSEFVPDAEREVASDPSFIPDSDFISDEDKYGSLGQQAITALEGAGASATFGLSTGLEKKLGVDPADIRARREENPISHMVGQGVGLVGSLLIPGGGAAKVLTGTGKLATRAAGLGAAEGLAAKAAQGAVSAAAENALFQAGDEVSKMLSNDPHQSVETALTNVGLSSLFGAGVGGALGAAPKLWKASVGDRSSQFLEDFRGRMKEHIDNPDPGGLLVKELDDLYSSTKSVADEVYGPTGIKAQEIKKLMPEMGEKISAQATDLIKATEETITKLGDDPLANRMARKLQDFKNAIAGERDAFTGGVKRAATADEVFTAAQDFKQELQAWSKFNKIAPPAIAERDFIRAAKELSHTFRNALEDEKIWGNVAKRQGVINKAFSEYLPALKNFESKFTTELGGERVIDPGKVQTFLNQADKMSGAVKREMLGNFIDAAEKYKQVIGDSHHTLGIESPVVNTPLNLSKASLRDLPAGAKLADALVKRGAAKLSGDALGAATGEIALGSLIGMPGIGAIIGQHALGPFLSSILPAIAKPLMMNRASSTALRGATEYGLSVIKGDQLIKKGARSVFKTTREVLPASATEVSQREREKLEERLADIERNPESLLSMGGDSGYYLPSHSMAMGETAGRVVNYLNSIKPKPLKLAPLDDEIEPSQEEMYAYEQALNIAEKPLSILEKVKDSTLLPTDLMALNSMYPSVYMKLKQAFTDQIIEQEGENIPYSLKQTLSLFMGEPLDSTLTPIGVQAAQMSASMNTAQQQRIDQTNPQPKAKTNGLTKIADSYRSPSESSLLRKNQV